ncbi:MAG TPA: hypothetical protein VJN21_01250 [Candidatus Acidoferrales bacterium]|nr:hypothetical protein [Candidatus Acidoferrales bacterium]
MNKIPRRIFLLALFALFASQTSAIAADTITWKPVADAILRITGRKPAKAWAVYQDQKNRTRVLVKIDSRCLIIDAKAKEVFEITADKIQERGKKFQSPDPAANQRALPSADWDLRDIGPAERIQARLTDENISIEVELPHPMDLRTPY